MTRQEESNGEANHPLTSNIQSREMHGFGVISGGEITVNTGTLGSTDTLSVEASEVLVDGTQHSVSAQDIGLDASDSDPRQDVIYVDSNGAIQVAKGTPDTPQSNVTNPSYTDYTHPVPADLAHVDATVLYQVWVPASGSITSSELIDRRTTAEIVTDRVDSNSVNTEHAGIKHGHSRNEPLSVGRERLQVQTSPTVAIVYDDGNLAEYTDAFEVHKQYGMPGTTSMIPPRLENDPDAMDTDQLREMVEWGWGVACHNGYDGLGSDQLDGDHSSGQGYLELLGGESLSGQQYGDGTKVVADYEYLIYSNEFPTTREIVTVSDVDFSTSPPRVHIEGTLDNSYPGDSHVWLTRRSMEREVGGAKQQLLEKGFTTSTYVYNGNNTGGPSGRSVVSEFFDYARSDHDDNGLNTLPINQYSLSAQGLPDADSAYLDAVESNNALGIIYTHIDSSSASTRSNQIDDLLSRLESRDISVVTLDEAAAAFGGKSHYKRPAETGRVAWYPFIRDGNTVRDVAGVHDGSWTNSASYVTSAHGVGASFDQDDGNHIVVPHDPALNPGTGNFSVVATFEITGASNQNYVIGKNDGGTSSWLMRINGPRSEIQVGATDNTNSFTTVNEHCRIEAGTVVQICWVRDADNDVLRLFTDASHNRGGPNEKAYDGSGDISPTADLVMGATPTIETPFNLYDVQIFNRVVEREELVTWDQQTLPASLHEDDLRTLKDGGGVVATTPDGTSEYRIRVDNSGNVVTDQL